MLSDKRQGSSKEGLEAFRSTAFFHFSDRLFCRGPRTAEILKGRQNIVFHSAQARVCSWRRRAMPSRVNTRHLFFQLENNTFRSLLTDPRYSDQPRHIAS